MEQHRNVRLYRSRGARRREFSDPHPDGITGGLPQCRLVSGRGCFPASRIEATAEIRVPIWPPRSQIIDAFFQLSAAEPNEDSAGLTRRMVCQGGFFRELYT